MNAANLRAMPAHQLERNAERCLDALSHMDYHRYTDDDYYSTRFLRIHARLIAYRAELDRRTDLEALYANLHHDGTLTDTQYSAAITAITA